MLMGECKILFFFFSGTQMWNDQVDWISRHHPPASALFLYVYVLEARYFSLPLLGNIEREHGYSWTLGEDQKSGVLCFFFLVQFLRENMCQYLPEGTFENTPQSGASMFLLNLGLDQN